MKRALRSQVTIEHSANNKPQITVKPGEVFEAETELCSWDWLQSIDSVFDGEHDRGPNPTVVIAVEGTAVGDSIRVHIHSIAPDALGYTGFMNREHELANKLLTATGGTMYGWYALKTVLSISRRL